MYITWCRLQNAYAMTKHFDCVWWSIAVCRPRILTLGSSFPLSRFQTAPSLFPCPASLSITHWPQTDGIFMSSLGIGCTGFAFALHQGTLMV